ncbi:hypothetical protein PCANC_25860 [Puccinia coronata f. sp. avenae]|uniref:Uncharacterized protein n=1 Tax=Puccinia coronata f. sp. avenae TaxID=200324 RepID=A0A2N5U5U1_9BASI|nr:hypothetical protein PCANC_25860 [Puccinia coronata f. sp. avenae]PLW33123.1 hypothetical protein PCASD_17567 [Puccinia coronata f. sp. avenae]
MSPRLVPRTRTLQIYFLFDHLVPLQDKTTYGFLLVEQAVVQAKQWLQAIQHEIATLKKQKHGRQFHSSLGIPFFAPAGNSGTNMGLKALEST